MEKYKFARKFCQNSVYIIVITNKYEGAKNLWNKDGGGKEENMSEGLLKIFKGANGGYKLNREPKDITLRDAVETIEDEIIIKDRSCVAGQTSCSIIFEALEKVENNFLKNLEKVNFQELTCPHVPLKIEDEIK